MTKVDFGALYRRCAKARGPNDPARRRFFEEIRPLLTKVVANVAWQFNQSAELEELIQEANVRLLSVDPDAVPRDPSAAQAYFATVAANASRDWFRARNATRRSADATISLDDLNERFYDDLAVNAGTDGKILMSQLVEMLPDNPRDRTVFRLYYGQGFTVKEIAKMRGISLTDKGIESLLHRLARSLQIKLSGEEKESL